jgi:hypothetical protein
VQWWLFAVMALLAFGWQARKEAHGDRPPPGDRLADPPDRAPGPGGRAPASRDRAADPRDGASASSDRAAGPRTSDPRDPAEPDASGSAAASRDRADAAPVLPTARRPD